MEWTEGGEKQLNRGVDICILELKANLGNGGKGEMATQVETLLPNNPLLKQDEHGHAGSTKRDEGCLEQGANQAAAGAGGDNAKGGESEQGGLAVKEQGRRQAKDGGSTQDKDSCDKETPNSKDDNGQGEGGARKEFTEAPPPKVNPWTKKMTVVSVNGQAHPGTYPRQSLSLRRPILKAGGCRWSCGGESGPGPPPPSLTCEATAPGGKRALRVSRLAAKNRLCMEQGPKPFWEWDSSWALRRAPRARHGLACRF